MSLLAPLLLAVPLLGSSGPFASDRPVTFPKALDRPGFLSAIFDVGAAYVSGQPEPDALRALAKEGFTTIVSVRTKEEMDNRRDVTFDEAALVKELGMRYVHIPFVNLGPDLVKKFAETMKQSEGKVLLHCTVAWRASYMWMAYLITDRKQSVDEAWRAGMNMSVTVDRTGLMLDQEVSYMASARREGARKPKDGVVSKAGSKLRLTAPKAVNPPSEDWRAFVMWDLGSILNASQPDEKKLRELAAQGVKTIVNIRGTAEMEDLKRNGFDEEALAKELGMTYHNIPLTSWKTFTPEALDQIAKAFEAADGKILYHCQSANRTTQALVPYLVKYQGMSVDEATKIGEAMRWNNMLSELLGVDFSYALKPKAKAGGG